MQAKNDFRAGETRNRFDRLRLLAMWDDQLAPAHFWEAAFGAACELESPYLAFVLRTDQWSDRAQLKRFNAILDQLDKEPRAATVKFVTPREALEAMGLLEGTSTLPDT
ncbi:MAG TPA: hypothetical protein VMR97_11075 [Acidimicrobiales bacterium]|nr:hypothetical protein [Acidimicrobiales bacterium]